MQQPSSEVNNQSKYYGNIQKFGKNVPFEVTLTKIDKITHDSYVYTYELPYPDLPLGLEPCQHIWIEAELPTKENPQGEVVKRKYTPISGADQKGTFDLLIKIYRRDVHPKFPDGGVLTQYLETLKVGDKIKIYGPVWKVTYHGHGHTTGKKEDKVYEIKSKRIGLVAGGTGIAPMFQVIKAVLDDPEDKTELSLLFANKTEGDILIKKELDAYSSDPRLKVYYTLDEASPEWKGFTGYVTPEMLQKTMPAPAEDTMVRMSGPKPMNQMVWGQLQALGHNVDLIW